jgi:hypothetical protein
MNIKMIRLLHILIEDLNTLGGNAKVIAYIHSKEVNQVWVRHRGGVKIYDWVVDVWHCID